jgi:malate/lactate dehydrogenase
LPTVVNEKGAIERVKLALSKTEETQLQNSAKVLHEVLAKLDI